MTPLTHASLFSGIGGFDLAAEWAGWTNLFSCEKDAFCQTVLKYHFPDATQYSDIRDTDFTIWRGRVDVLTGGFPCQPFSVAGKRKGTDDDRYLWPEMLRAIREIHPRWIVGENVRGIVNWNAGMVFEQVCVDLEDEGYEVTPYLVPACGVGAPHRRDRVWFVAKNTYGIRCDGHRPEKESDTGGFGKSGAGDHGRVCGETGATADRADTGAETMREGTHGVLSDEATANAASFEDHRRRPGGFQPEPSGAASERVAPDTDYERCKQFDTTSEPSQSGQFGRGISKGDATDTASCGWVKNDESKCSKQPAQAIPHWRNFPAQSPVCLRDDGLSNWVDDEALLAGRIPRQPYISTAKLRQESVKAYGNAIVPQVAYQIFKAINETTK